VDTAAALAEIQNHPRFLELAAMVQRDPQVLQQILPLLAQEQPEMMDLINANREAFAELLLSAGGGALGGVMSGQGSGFRLTPDELQAVSRLQELGFPRSTVVEAYLACDKKEEIAAGYLFENGGFEEDQK